MLDVSELGTAARPDMFRALLDGLPAMIGYWDRDLRNRMANSAYLEWVGITPEQAHGMHIRDVLGPELYEQNLPHMERALAGEQQLFDRTIVDARSATRHTQASYIPDVADGEVRGFFVLVTDITAHVTAELQVQQSAEQYRALVRSIPSGFVLLFDADLRYQVADGEALEAFGCQSHDLEGRTLYEAFPLTMAAELEPHYRAALTGQSTSWDRVRGDRVFHLTAGPVTDRDGRVFAGNVVCTDVTTERRAAATARALHAIATLVATNATVDDVVALVAERMHDVFGFDQAAVVRFEDEERGVIVAMIPAMPSVAPALRLGPEEPSAAAGVARTRAPALSTYAASHTGTAGQLYASGLRSGGAAPIWIRGRLWGVVAVGSAQPGAVGESTLERLASFAELVEIAIGNASAWSKLNERATTDTMTGLPNRASFHEHLGREVAEAERSGRPVSLVLLDIDRFKDVNDAFGHPAGDRVIAEVARRLAATARDHEVVGRIGGEEFAWVLPGTDASAACAAAERARRAISDVPFEEAGRLTISVGVCERVESRNADTFMTRADEALYAAKRAGRNRTVRYVEPQRASIR